MSLLTRLSHTSQHPTMTLHNTLSTALHLKTAALLGACIYQVISVSVAKKDAQGNVGVGVDLSKGRRNRFVREFVRDRAEEWWAVWARGKDERWIEARREIKAKWRAEREKSRRATWEKKKEREGMAGSVKSKSNAKGKDQGKWDRKGTIFRVTFPWGRSGGGGKGK